MALYTRCDICLNHVKGYIANFKLFSDDRTESKNWDACNFCVKKIEKIIHANTAKDNDRFVDNVI